MEKTPVSSCKIYKSSSPVMMTNNPQMSVILRDADNAYENIKFPNYSFFSSSGVSVSTIPLTYMDNKNANTLLGYEHTNLPGQEVPYVDFSKRFETSGDTVAKNRDAATLLGDCTVYANSIRECREDPDVLENSEKYEDELDTKYHEFSQYGDVYKRHEYSVWEKEEILQRMAFSKEFGHIWEKDREGKAVYENIFKNCTSLARKIGERDEYSKKFDASSWKNGQTGNLGQECPDYLNSIAKPFEEVPIYENFRTRSPGLHKELVGLFENSGKMKDSSKKMGETTTKFHEYENSGKMKDSSKKMSETTTKFHEYENSGKMKDSSKKMGEISPTTTKFHEYESTLDQYCDDDLHIYENCINSTQNPEEEKNWIINIQLQKRDLTNEVTEKNMKHEKFRQERYSSNNKVCDTPIYENREERYSSSYQGIDTQICENREAGYFCNNHDIDTPIYENREKGYPSNSEGIGIPVYDNGEPGYSSKSGVIDTPISDNREPGYYSNNKDRDTPIYENYSTGQICTCRECLQDGDIRSLDGEETATFETNLEQRNDLTIVNSRESVPNMHNNLSSLIECLKVDDKNLTDMKKISEEAWNFSDIIWQTSDSGGTNSLNISGSCSCEETKSDHAEDESNPSSFERHVSYLAEESTLSSLSSERYHMGQTGLPLSSEAYGMDPTGLPLSSERYHMGQTGLPLSSERYHMGQTGLPLSSEACSFDQTGLATSFEFREGEKILLKGKQEIPSKEVDIVHIYNIEGNFPRITERGPNSPNTNCLSATPVNNEDHVLCLQGNNSDTLSLTGAGETKRQDEAALHEDFIRILTSPENSKHESSDDQYLFGENASVGRTWPEAEAIMTSSNTRHLLPSSLLSPSSTTSLPLSITTPNPFSKTMANLSAHGQTRRVSQSIPNYSGQTEKNSASCHQNKEHNYASKDIYSTDLAKLKAMAVRLKLTTRRPSYLAWLQKTPLYPLSGHLVTESLAGGAENRCHEPGETSGTGTANSSICNTADGLEVTDSSGFRDVENGRLTSERKHKIEKSLDWLRTELQLMRMQDQALARQLLSLYHDIHRVRLSWSCQEHRDLLDEVRCDLEELYEFSNVLDLPRTCLLNTPLKHVGLTRLNISARRFSTC